jgi:hypothetical protein
LHKFGKEIEINEHNAGGLSQRKKREREREREREKEKRIIPGGIAWRRQRVESSRLDTSMRSIGNTNLSGTAAVTCHLHVFSRSGLDAVRLGKYLGTFVELGFACGRSPRRRIAFLLSSLLWISDSRATITIRPH